MPTIEFRYRHRLRKDAFRRYCNLAGLHTWEAVADEMGVATSTVTRTLNSDLPVGDAFLSGAIGMFANRGVRRGEVIEELFDLVKDDIAINHRDRVAA